MTFRKNQPASTQSGRFTLSAVGIAVMCCFAGIPAHALAQAQDSTKTESAETEKIEVRGIRASSAENLAIKRLSNAVVDAITAEDIGKFPDKNVADSLQRVPGVVIQRNGGEGSSVSIRGLSPTLTFTQLNGNFIAASSGNPSRSFSYELLPSNLVGKVELFKSSEARLDEGGVGGTVIVHSRKPLDMEKNSGVVSLEYTYADITDKYEPQLSGIYSWKTDEEDFGFLVGFTQQDRTNRTQTSRVNIINKNYEYTERRDGQVIEGGAQGFARQSFVQDVLEEDRQRTGVQFTAQWRPTDNFEIGFNYFQFKLGLDSVLNQLEYPEWHDSNQYMTNVFVDADAQYVTGIDYGRAISGQALNAQIPRMNGEYKIEESTSDTFDFFAEYEGDNFNLKFVAGHTEAEGGPSEKYRAAYYSGGTADYWGWRFDNKNLITNIDSEIFNRLKAGEGGQADIGATDSSFVGGTQEEDYAQIDTDWFVDWGIVETLRFGMKYRKGSIFRDTRNTFYLAKDFDVAAGEARPDGINLDDDYSRNGGIPLLTTVIADQPLGNLGGSINTNIFPAVNWHKYQQELQNNFKRYTRYEPDYVYEVEEEVKVAYVQADYKWENLRGNFGVRFVDTVNTNTASDRLVFRLDRFNLEGGDVSQANGVVTETVVNPKENSYSHVLPSFNIAWDMNDDWVLRGAAAKVISRPDYADLGSYQTLTYRSSEWEADSSSLPEFNPIRDGEGWTGGGGNSSLRPLESVQYDLSLEYYYGEGSGISLALFLKNIDNFVVPFLLDVNTSVPDKTFTLVESGGGTVSVGGDIVVRDYDTRANGTDAESKGMEFSFQHFFDNGFGVSGNYTRNITNSANIEADGSVVGQSQLTGSSKYQGNLSAFYEDDLYSVRVSYNQRGPTIGQLEGNPKEGWNLNRFSDTYDQIDVNASYSITDDLTLNASVINLTKSEGYVHLGNDTKVRFLTNSYSGRRFFAGINYRF
ncbi:TonB-dependent receptor [Paraglaciecola sp.]|uniref:TonB-dependent receptor n=1 Tax=Paraglaciecola sp. TaxID=1920173 RepID=UPI0030F400D0